MSLRSFTVVGGEEGSDEEPLPQFKSTVPAPFISANIPFCSNHEWNQISIFLHMLCDKVTSFELVSWISFMQEPLKNRLYV